MSKVQQLWVGYDRRGGKSTFGLEGLGCKVLLLGSRANDLAAVAAIASKEAGANPILLDLGGSLANRLSGHFDTFDYRSFLYDAFRLAPPEPWHSQLVAAAYTAALDLSAEEEAIVNSALQAVATEGSIASPVSLYDVLGKVEGFRGFYVDRVKGRIGSLRLFDAVDDQTFERLIGGNALVDFRGAPYPQAAELAAALFLAKMLSMAHAAGPGESPVMLTEAHRVFHSSPRPLHSGRLLVQFLGSPSPSFIASEQEGFLSPQAIEACAVRFYSSDAWHTLRPKEGRVLPGAFVLDDMRAGRRQVFVPRRIVAKTADYIPSRSAKYSSPELTVQVLEAIERFPLSTRESITQYLAAEFLPADIGTELTGLHSKGCLIVEPKETGSGPPVFAYTVSDKGRKLLQELRP